MDTDQDSKPRVVLTGEGMDQAQKLVDYYGMQAPLGGAISTRPRQLNK
jgi:hypothetical protein